jgi:UDP-N-acetylglucosamine--N-acetylmuramyl-(pentapeptide) pyrophosphoryl-undecaprenol N-acetylglucosamine transferase
MSAPLTVVFAGGGTGGHLFPGIAIAEALRTLRPDTRISFAGSASKIEARVVPAHGYAFDPIWISGFRRSFSLATALLPLKLAVSVLQTMRLLRRRRPQVVVGTGGYVSGPVVWTAAKLGYRTLIHEQNEYPGATTRRLAGLVDEVHITFEASARHLAHARRVVASGNPVRPSLRRLDTAEARARFGLDASRPVLFVFGGSLGAGSINRAILAGLERLADAHVQVLWQTGAADLTQARAAAASHGGIVVLPFIDDMAAAYSAASLVVCRAGATSLAELSAMQMPALLIPYPHAAADHQRRNARAMEAAGAAAYLDDDEIREGDGSVLVDRVLALMCDADALAAMAARTATLARPDAARSMAEAIVRLSHGAERGR